MGRARRGWSLRDLRLFIFWAWRGRQVLWNGHPPKMMTCRLWFAIGNGPFETQCRFLFRPNSRMQLLGWNSNQILVNLLFETTTLRILLKRIHSCSATEVHNSLKRFKHKTQARRRNKRMRAHVHSHMCLASMGTLAPESLGMWSGLWRSLHLRSLVLDHLSYFMLGQSCLRALFWRTIYLHLKWV